MMLEFGFGQGVERVEVPQDNLLGVLTPNQVELGLTGEAEVRRACLLYTSWRRPRPIGWRS